MIAILEAENLYKEFSISKKQQKLLMTSFRKIVAVKDLAFKLYKGEIFGLLGTNEQVKQQERCSWEWCV